MPNGGHISVNNQLSESLGNMSLVAYLHTSPLLSLTERTGDQF